MWFSVSLPCPLISQIRRHACPAHLHLVTQMSLCLLEASCLLHSQREGLFDVWTRYYEYRTEFFYSTSISQVSVGFRYSGEYRIWGQENRVQILVLLPTVHPWTALKWWVWWELALHRHHSNLPSLPVVQSQVVTTVIYVNIVNGTEIVYFTMSYSPWKIAKSLTCVNT